MRWNKQTRTLESSLIHHPISPQGSSATTQTEVSLSDTGEFGLQPISQGGSWDIKAPIQLPSPTQQVKSAYPDTMQLPAWLPAGGSSLGTSSHGLGRSLWSWSCRVVMMSGDVISLEKAFKLLFHFTLPCYFWQIIYTYICMYIYIYTYTYIYTYIHVLFLSSTCRNRLTEVLGFKKRRLPSATSCDRLPDIHMINSLTCIFTGLSRLCCPGSRSPPIDFYCLVCIRIVPLSLKKERKWVVTKTKI